MPGRPKLRALMTQLQNRGGPEFFQDYLLGGGTISGLAKELEVDRGYLRRNLIKKPEYNAVIEQVRETAADTHAELGFDVIRQLKADRAAERANAQTGSRLAEISQVDVTLAREEVSQHKFIAQSWNQNRYANGKANTNVTVNLGDLHLDALRKMKLVRDSAKEIEHE
jgi:hypothetical protein